MKYKTINLKSKQKGLVELLAYNIITLLYDLATSQKRKTLLIKVIERNKQSTKRVDMRDVIVTNILFYRF